MLEVIINIINNIITFAPIIFLFFLVNLSERDRTLENPGKGKELGIISYALVILGFSFTLMVGLLLHFQGKQILQLMQVLSNGPAPEGLQQSPSGLAEVFPRVENIGLGLWVPSLLAILMFIPVIRRGLSVLIPIDPFRRTHAVALSMSMLILLNLFVTLGVGLETLTKVQGQASEAGTLALLWSQDILLALLGLIGVGWLTRRNGSESLKRLGLVKPTAIQLLIGFGSGIALVIVVLIIQWIAALIGVAGDPHVEELTEKMLGSLFNSVPGILTLGLAAALGEEIIFRGALQPRFGIIFTSLLFAMVHANYGFSLSTLVVLLLGLCLGFVRKRLNTVVSMVIHATYNITWGVLSVFMS
ncbi:CPBP family intramembrane glutamic endopeptidase [Paenactinomyces guangxiensis]|uniref:CPBP family intramembrane metalloprotease n=1 Tax=Paenactinomyces guangxiensis TaxID=1490290 RepID=A0A7W1WTU8_9BACL|nr:CPBP family intramembrane glutamic endopeptidase [Paenactinomyces guangxiensis]MBA4495939.1 CPBP family intramembrane metalloprotease [Paenactinomyces guangxiensis]MBH8593074.1 CPBP family intramembrane metalloprotease [Paenactinomyces guangxiensis]